MPHEAVCKTCSKCGKEQDVSNFYRRARSSDGLAVWCKPCVRDYRQVNADRIKEQSRKAMGAYRARHPARAKDSYRRWREQNLQSERMRGRVKSASRRSAPGTHSAQDILRLLDVQEAKCAACGCSIANKYHVDHIKPLARGGSNYPDNLQLLCAPCNLSKGARDNDEFMSLKQSRTPT